MFTIPPQLAPFSSSNSNSNTTSSSIAPSHPPLSSDLQQQNSINSFFDSPQPNNAFIYPALSDSNCEFWLSLLSENNHTFSQRSAASTSRSPPPLPSKVDNSTPEDATSSLPPPPRTSSTSSTSPTTEKSAELSDTDHLNKNGKRSRTSPPRPPNAFILYRKDMSSEFLRSKTGEFVRNGEISKVIGEMWKNESEPVRSSYYSKAAEAKRAHAEKYPEYKYRPARAAGNGKHRAEPSGGPRLSSPRGTTTSENPSAPQYQGQSPRDDRRPTETCSFPVGRSELPPPLPVPPDLSTRPQYLDPSPSVVLPGSDGTDRRITWVGHDGEHRRYDGWYPPPPSTTAKSRPTPADPACTIAGRLVRQQPQPHPNPPRRGPAWTDDHSDDDLPPSGPEYDPGPDPRRHARPRDRPEYFRNRAKQHQHLLSKDTAGTIAVRLVRSHPEIQAVLAEAYLAKYLENHHVLDAPPFTAADADYSEPLASFRHDH